MITVQNFASVSDVRDKTARVVKEVNQYGKKIILSQNKPVCVILSIDEYNNMKKLSFEKEQATKDDIKAYKESSHGESGTEAFSFLENLEK